MKPSIYIPKPAFRLNESSALRSLLDDNIYSNITADKLQINDQVIIKKTSFKGQEGTIDSFGKNKAFVLVKLSSGVHVFHSSDVVALNVSAEDEEDEDIHNSDIKKFYVAFYDSTRETSWIGLVTREGGGMWHEKRFRGLPIPTWGKEYETYMLPSDITNLYHRKFPHSLNIEGPFMSADKAEDFINDNWGQIRESVEQVSEGLSEFNKNALKAINSVLRYINADQEKTSPSYSIHGAAEMKAIHRILYSGLMDGDVKEFINAWDKAASEDTSAFDAFSDILFDQLQVKDFPELLKKLGYKKENLKEALNADGFHISLKNPSFCQNETLLIHGDPRPYLHDESASKNKHTKKMLVTFDKKALAEAYAKKLEGRIVTTPALTYRIVKDKPTKEIENKEVSYQDFSTWKKAVKDAYPKEANKFKFVGRIENGINTISAEIPGEDRSFAVWYVKKDKGIILSEEVSEMILLSILTEEEIKVAALNVATNLLGTKDVKHAEVDNKILDTAREFNKKVIFSADGQRWYISLFKLASGQRFARVIPPVGSNAKSYFIKPKKDEK